ncbi:MAG: protein kinase [Planctomyces sp.]|nr:protein kinase [Planctomyces sp.]
MLLLPKSDQSYCPYRDGLGINTDGGRVSWYQLLAVSQNSSPEELRHRYEQRRTMALHSRRTTCDPIWDNVLDELDRAFECLRHPVRKADYDEDLARRSRQTSLIRPCQLNEEELAEFQADTRTQRKPGNAPAKPSFRDRFEPLRTIGRGHQGTKVFEAYEHTLGRTVAVKCLEKNARKPARCRSFTDEAKFLASTSHPNLIEIHSVNEQSCFYVMELLGEPLAKHSRFSPQKGCSPDVVTEFLAQGLSVLAHLHEKGVIHGGLCLRSFLVTETGTIKLSDAPGCTRNGLFRKPAPDQLCLAPELLSPDTFGTPGFSTDLYMIGFMAVQLLAGDQIAEWFPKVGSPEEQDMRLWHRWHSSPIEKLPALQTLVPMIPPGLASLIERLCEKQVIDRYSSAAEALKAVNALTTRAPAVGISAVETRSADSVASSEPGPAVEIKGGGSPCVVDARTLDQESPDLLTILQDPELLWQHFRRNRKFQLIVGVFAAALVLTALIPSSESIEDSRDAISESVVESPVPPADNRRVNSKPVDTPPPMPTTPALPRRPAVVAAEIPDLEIIPVVARADVNPPKPRDERRRTFSKQPTMLKFPVVGIRDAAKVEELRNILITLRDSRGNEERQKLFRRATQIAPEDPRPPLVFAAVNEFSHATCNDELQDAIRKSAKANAPFTQPIRKSVEMLLRGRWEERRVADQVIAELLQFRSKLNSARFEPDQRYEWEWIGRVLGYLESRSRSSEIIRTLLVDHASTLEDEIPSEARESIEAGRRWVVETCGATPAATTVFPAAPRIEIDLCLSTIVDPTIPSDPDALTAFVKASRAQKK